MDINELLEYLRGGDIPDCKKYKELLESEDKEAILLAIELLIADKVDKYQIKICRSRFLHEIGTSDDLIRLIAVNEPKYNNSLISSVI